MRFVPDGLSRKLSESALLVRKNSPGILFGAGVVSMVGSTVMASRATLKLHEVLNEVETNMEKANLAKAKVEAGDVPEGMTYTDHEMKQDIVIIYSRGAVKILKLYAPAIILGGVGIACLTRSHQILKERNAALTAAYLAVNSAFQVYRERVVERYGEEADREFRYGSEEVDIIDDETGKVVSTVVVEPGEPSGYARWFDETNANFTGPNDPNHLAYNYAFLRHNQNSANDMLKSRGHVFLNEVYSQLGLAHTSAGAAVGWIWDPHNENHKGDNYVDFGCWDEDGRGQLMVREFFTNGRDGSILLDFNVDGPIWDLIDKRKDSGK